GAARPGSIKERLDARRKAESTVGAASRVRRHVEEQVRGQVQGQLAKARAFFEQGRADYQAGRVIKAAGALELAVQFDPANDEYRALLETAKRESRGARIGLLIHQGEQAESYQQAKQAIHAYREAVALEPDSGKVYYRLAKLVRREEENDREALNLLRDAVLKDPDVVEYRLALGELYKELGLKLNARREFTEILKRDKGHEGAKAGLKDL
ncbi:hypothetical protein L6R53_31110, partial [Myxococcota bacterium]|nr:hypothetical protein [Myxococcota bacterium]